MPIYGRSQGKQINKWMVIGNYTVIQADLFNYRLFEL